MRELILHPECGSGPIERIEADIRPTPVGCEARFRLTGDLSRIHVPGYREPARVDGLWKTTCCEIFWQPEGGTAYREFNLSPSTCWAAYDFEDIRRNGGDGPAQVEIATVMKEHHLELECSIVSDLPLPAAAALNAVVEDREGGLQYWALAFADGKPDFHAAACRAVHLAGRL